MIIYSASVNADFLSGDVALLAASKYFVDQVDARNAHSCPTLPRGRTANGNDYIEEMERRCFLSKIASRLTTNSLISSIIR